MRHGFFLNVFLGLVWTFLQGELQAANFLVGLVLGYLVIVFSRHILGQDAYVRKVIQVLQFIGFTLWEIFRASLALAWIIIHPRLTLYPAIVAVPIDAHTDMEIVVLSNLITLSPGTLTLDVSDDRKTLYVHTMVLQDPEQFRRELKQGFERRVLEVMR